MLNFEDEMKAVKKGYVVMSLDDYNDLRDEIAAANMRAYEAEQLANRRVAELTQDHRDTLHGLLRAYKKPYGDRSIEVEFNKGAWLSLAIASAHRMLSAEELRGYEFKQPDDLILCDETIATHKLGIVNED